MILEAYGELTLVLRDDKIVAIYAERARLLIIAWIGEDDEKRGRWPFSMNRAYLVMNPAIELDQEFSKWAHEDMTGLSHRLIAKLPPEVRTTHL